MNLYVVTFDPHKTDAVSLHAAIASKSQWNAWWHYLGSTYILASSSSTKVVTREILEKWPKQRFFIAKLDTSISSNYSGWLPKEAWEWFKKYY